MSEYLWWCGLVAGGMLWASRKALFYLADKLDDAGRYIQRIDYKLGAKSYPSWFRSLVDDKVK